MKSFTCLLKNDVNVSSNKLGYLFSLCSLDGVVTLLVLSKILCNVLKKAEIQVNILPPIWHF